MSEDVAIIQSPGKFEGERAYMPLAFEHYLSGNCTEANDPMNSVYVTIVWNGEQRTVRFFVDDQGFVYEVHSSDE